MLGLTSRSRRRVRGMGAMQGFLPASDLGVGRLIRTSSVSYPHGTGRPGAGQPRCRSRLLRAGGACFVNLPPALPRRPHHSQHSDGPPQIHPLEQLEHLQAAAQRVLPHVIALLLPQVEEAIAPRRFLAFVGRTPRL